MQTNYLLKCSEHPCKVNRIKIVHKQYSLYYLTCEIYIYVFIYSSYVSLQLDFKYTVDLTMYKRQNGKTKKQRTNLCIIGNTIITYIHTFRERMFFLPYRNCGRIIWYGVAHCPNGPCANNNLILLIKSTQKHTISMKNTEQHKIKVLFKL